MIFSDYPNHCRCHLLLIRGIPAAYRQLQFIQILHFYVGLCRKIQGMFVWTTISWNLSSPAFTCLLRKVQKWIREQKKKNPSVLSRDPQTRWHLKLTQSASQRSDRSHLTAFYWERVPCGVFRNAQFAQAFARKKSWRRRWQPGPKPSGRSSSSSESI